MGNYPTLLEVFFLVKLPQLLNSIQEAFCLTHTKSDYSQTAAESPYHPDETTLKCNEPALYRTGSIFCSIALHRDDIIDIVDFDYVQYMYNIDRMMLNEELATAIMLGDGRDEGDADKIQPEHIRPIWLDDELYTMHVLLDIAGAKKELQGTNTGAHFGENYIWAEAMINTLLYSRENYRGSGTPDLFCTPHTLNVMLLARDLNGRRIYSSKAEIASALNVGEIYTCEQFENKTRTDSDGKTRKLLGIVANLSDYSLGSTKGGQISHFTQFDIDFNQEKSLLETRVSGALTRIYSAIAIEQDMSTPESGDNQSADDSEIDDIIDGMYGG